MNPTITIDGGATAGRARLHDASGAVTVTLDEPLSLTSVDRSDFLDRLGRLLALLPARSGVTAVTAGFAGAATAARTGPVSTYLQRRYRHAHVSVARDIDLVLAHLIGPGAALIVGTGAIVVGRGEDGREVVVDGRGFAIGDRGGGAWIGLAALRSALRTFDLTGRESPMLRALLSELGLPSDRGVASALAVGGNPSAWQVAAVAPVVLSLAEAAEADAVAIIDEAVAEVVTGVDAALRRVGCCADASIVVAGGIAGHRTFQRRLDVALTDHPAVGSLHYVDPLDAKRISDHQR